MIIHGYNRRDTQLAFCRVGDETWTALNGPRSSYQDIMYLSKHGKFYALCESDHLEAWDLSCPSSPKMTLVKSEYPSLRFFAGLNSGDELERAQLCRKKYLVDSSGELLLVLRLTKCFDVFKLDFDENKWMKVTSLGGRSLFLGTNECISVCAGDYINPGLRLREDSIYFTCVDAEVEPNTTSGAYHLGVFSMKNREIDVLYQDEYRKMDPHPVWIFPGL
ncbi:putative F-box protein At5g55150 [Coffea arabica]|uniref:F-box protein At5g55150 n=1 Tax=Coffea arabica TaxID=13443 RepID=A0A6P6SCG5_COFAR|nr:putative F-box protein At5g55150 [Coffea arabica]